MARVAPSRPAGQGRGSAPVSRRGSRVDGTRTDTEPRAEETSFLFRCSFNRRPINVLSEEARTPLVVDDDLPFTTDWIPHKKSKVNGHLNRKIGANRANFQKVRRSARPCSVQTPAGSATRSVKGAFILSSIEKIRDALSLAESSTQPARESRDSLFCSFRTPLRSRCSWQGRRHFFAVLQRSMKAIMLGAMLLFVGGVSSQTCHPGVDLMILIDRSR